MSFTLCITFFKKTSVFNYFLLFKQWHSLSFPTVAQTALLIGCISRSIFCAITDMFKRSNPFGDAMSHDHIISMMPDQINILHL